jgi:PAS domain S-box-containing protein
MSLDSLLAARVPLLPVLGFGATLLVLAILSLRRGHARAAVRASPRTPDRQHLRLLFEQLPVIVWSVDREMRIVEAAGSGLRAVRLGPGEIVGLTVAELLGDEAGSTGALELHRRALAGEAAAGEPSWRERDFHVRVEPLRETGGGIVGAVGVALDVTEQRRREASWPEAQRLESLGVLAGSIAHDLANLLGGVVGHAELALSRIAPGDPARGHLERAIEGTHRCGDLLHQILAHAGRAEERREPVDLGSLVRGMGDLLRVAIGAGCELRYEMEDGLPPVEADAAQIRQIVMNLITNGAEAIGAGSGSVTVTAARCRLGAEELAAYQFGDGLAAGDYVTLRVDDTGGGMTEEVRARIFEPFFSTKRPGRGLGLAAVLGIVRKHGGALRVESAPGHGTSFEILLPHARRAERLAS